MKEKIRSFVIDTIFPAFDELRYNEFFQSFINDESVFYFDNVEYVGYKGFSRWLNGMRDILHTNGLIHTVKTFDVTKLSMDQYQVKFIVETEGVMKNGDRFDVTVEEEWILDYRDDNFIFKSYKTNEIKGEKDEDISNLRTQQS